MSRTVELGRAVLCSQSTNLELWLTTLITILPQQDSIDIEQLNENALISFLSSGNVWVGRGNGMYAKFDITVHREPLAGDQLRQLAENMIDGPAWKQLNLRPSLPTDQVAEHGKLHINIGQCRSHSNTHANKSHRICANVPSADVNPPKGIPTILLQSVQFAMAIRETKDSSTTARRKRPKHGPRSKANEPPPPVDSADSNSEDDEDSDMLFSEEPEIVDVLYDEESTTPSQLPSKVIQGRKRHRYFTAPIQKREGHSFVSSVALSKRLRSPTISAAPLFPLPNLSSFQHYQTLIDAAIRLSVCSNLRGSASGLKIKANTFDEGLADIAPSLWRLGYLTALSQRIYLAPTLGLALSRVSLRSRSDILRGLTGAFSSPSTQNNKDQLDPVPFNKLIVGDLSFFMAEQIWIHAQKVLLSKPISGTIQPFYVKNANLA